MQRAGEFPVHELLINRYSPRSFLDRDIDESNFRMILEAGRWAPSCFNEQPWACVYAFKGDREGFSRILGCLTPKNQSWASRAGVLMITAARHEFADASRANRYALHDTGSFLMSMLIQGVALGIYGHPMAGFSQKTAREELGIPEQYELAAAVAWGYPGAPEECPEEFREKEAFRTGRREQEQFAFKSVWPG